MLLFQPVDLCLYRAFHLALVCPLLVARLRIVLELLEQFGSSVQYIFRRLVFALERGDRTADRLHIEVRIAEGLELFQREHGERFADIEYRFDVGERHRADDARKVFGM